MPRPVSSIQFIPRTSDTMKIRLALVCVALLFQAPSSIQATEPLPKVKMFTTGGTIQSRGAHRELIMDYGAGRVGPQELIDDLPELHEVADVSFHEIANVGSPSVDTTILLTLAREINAWLSQPDSAGAVVTHGTATLEETAYFLNLTVRSEKPVVVVGAMRPFTAISRDGPFNLYNAFRVAGSPSSRGKGVLILLNDEINTARHTTKSDANRLETFVARDLGPIGFADSDRIVYYRNPIYRHTYRSEFDVSALTELPRVDVNYGYQEGDGVEIDTFVANGARGVVLTGRGGDNMATHQQQGIVFVSSDRKGAGRVLQSAGAARRGVVTSDNLPPHKARILLRLALSRTTDTAEIQRMFNEY